MLQVFVAQVVCDYARVSKADGSQSLDLQQDALRAEGVEAINLYHDLASGVRDDRPGLDSCLRALRKGDVLIVWKLDRLGRNLAHLVNTVQDLSTRGVGLRVLAGQGAQIDTTTAAGRLVFGIFAALAEFERELIRERTLVVRHVIIFGYTDLSLQRASSTFICQSTPRCVPLTSVDHADTSACSVSRSPIRRPRRHWRVIELSSFSAMFSQLP